MQQDELQLNLHSEPVLVPDHLVRAKTSQLAAIKLCVTLATDPCDPQHKELTGKQIYGPVDIDAAHWSRILNGQHHLAADKYGRLMRVCGNLAPLQWMAWDMGYGLHRLKSRLETELEEERSKREAAEERERYLIQILNGKAGT